MHAAQLMYNYPALFYPIFDADSNITNKYNKYVRVFLGGILTRRIMTPNQMSPFPITSAIMTICRHTTAVFIVRIM
jgi:hypothetical protein